MGGANRVTVIRQKADFVSDFISFFLVSQLKQFNFPVILFLIGRLFQGIGDQIAIGRSSADNRSTVAQLLMKNEPLG